MPASNRLRTWVLVALYTAVPLAARAQEPVAYRFSFPQAEHRWMQVQLTLANLPDGPVELRMSRSSPGRYALHEFARHVFDVHARDEQGRPLTVTRSDPHGWTIPDHAGRLIVHYRVAGDRLDGTALAIDSTHAHINMPAALLWVRGLERRPITMSFDVSSHPTWRIATQLMASPEPHAYTAPNLQYAMDSPVEIGPIRTRTFTVDDGPRRPEFRLAVHHQGGDEEVDHVSRDAERIVRQAREVFGRFPAFDAGQYTFLTDHLPWAHADGMEHRNSTVITTSATIAAGRQALRETLAHEFFHVWNVERIRPRSLEPFDFERANPSGELWLAEGFTQYYGPLLLVRAGLLDLEGFVGELGAAVDTVVTSPAWKSRSLEEMSYSAPLVDGPTTPDRVPLENTYLSYYTWGQVVALALDLSLRERSGGTSSLDHLMRALWEEFGAPGEGEPGYVGRPYTRADVTTTLARVSGDPAFASDFVARYIQGRELPDLRSLLARAGLVLRPARPKQASAGRIRVEKLDNRVRVTGYVPFDSPAYRAGIERDDVLLSIDGSAVREPSDVTDAVRRRAPGDELTVIFERRGAEVRATLRLEAEPQLEIVPAERANQALTADQRRWRQAWLGVK